MPESTDPSLAEPITEEQDPIKIVEVQASFEDNTNAGVTETSAKAITTPLVELIRFSEGKIAPLLCVGKEDGRIAGTGTSKFYYEGRWY